MVPNLLNFREPLNGLIRETDPPVKVYIYSNQNNGAAMPMDPQRFEEIAKEIHSDTSPVGIDAKKTHILIIQMLQDIDARLAKIESHLAK